MFILYSEISGGTSEVSEHLYQDPLEAFSGRQQMSCGRNDNPTVKTFLQNIQCLYVCKNLQPCNCTMPTAGGGNATLYFL